LTSRGEHTILVVPVGEPDPGVLERICEDIARVLGFGTRIQPLIEDLSFAYDPGRDQYHSTLILEKLADRAPADALKVLAVVPVDLFIPILTHVYGEAQLGGRTSVISSFRLKRDSFGSALPQKLLDRMAKEAIHELGHTFSLRHCPEENCIMHYCRDEADVDRKSDQLCRYCRTLVADEMRRLAD